MIKVIEAFSGIGAQVQALENINASYEVVATVDWDISAIYAYDILHNGPQYLKDYRHHSKDSLLKCIEKFNLSNNGKNALTYRGRAAMPMQLMKVLLHAIERNNNLVDITMVNPKELPKGDLLTYSFPCQDLSISKNFHNIKGGMSRTSDTRSGLLWEIERILKSYVEGNRDLPTFLLMENVPAILSSQHIEDFEEWKDNLNHLGYFNHVVTLNSKYFGVPQSRERTYMLSVLCFENKRLAVKEYLDLNNLQIMQESQGVTGRLSNYLKLDYNNSTYRDEAIISTPVFTPSRQRIFDDNKILATDQLAHDEVLANTITTKQDRNPNSGIISYDKFPLVDHNEKYRNLTSRECFLLMGFSEEKYELLLENNFKINSKTMMFTEAKLIKLAGNSIVVPVLEAIFKQVIEIQKILN